MLFHVNFASGHQFTQLSSPYRIPRKRGGIENIDGFGVRAQERRQLSVLQVRGVIRVRYVVVLAHQGVAVLCRRHSRRPMVLWTGSCNGISLK